MSKQQPSERNIAMLIDSDNVSYKLIKEVIEEVSQYGKITCRRVYGDWSLPQLTPWKQAMQANALEGIHKWRGPNGKNATDIDLVIDAMDILQRKVVHGFCIISSDSDFTGLCMKIRAEGLFIMGVGEKKAPEAFRNACDVFLYIEDIPLSEKKAPIQVLPQANTTPKKPKHAKALLRHAFDISPKADGWANLNTLEHVLQQIDSKFNTNDYGCKNLSELIKHLTHLFTIREEKEASSYVRIIGE